MLVTRRVAVGDVQIRPSLNHSTLLIAADMLAKGSTFASKASAVCGAHLTAVTVLLHESNRAKVLGVLHDGNTNSHTPVLI